MLLFYPAVGNTERLGNRKHWKKVGLILLTVAFVIVPLGGLMLVIYGGARHLGKRKRQGSSPDGYSEWLAIRTFARAHTVDRFSRARRRVESSAGSN
jgi:hypothetical protein